MQSEKRKSNKRKTFLTAEISLLLLALTACAGMPKVTPHFLDTQLNELREYEVLDAERMTLRYRVNHPLPRSRDGYGNGFVCVPQEEAVAWRNWCLKNECTKAKTLFTLQEER